MSKIFKLYLMLTMLFITAMVVSCDDEEVDELLVPEITAVNPTSGVVGDEVVITGTNLVGVTNIRFGTVDVNDTDFTATDTEIRVNVPVGVTAGVQTITVTSPDGSDVIDFTVLEEVAVPTFTAFDPVSGFVGDVITVTGTDLDVVTGATLGETEITDFTAAEDGTTATFTVPEGATSGFITLRTEAGDEVVSPEEFVVGTEDVAFEPLTGPVGTEVTLTGIDFTGTTAVRLGDMDITDFTVADDASNVVFTVPEGALSGLISVTTEAGDFVSAEEFIVEGAETAFDFEPAVGPVGSEVTLTGMDFTGTTGLRIGEVDVTDFTVAEDGSNIVFTVPEGAVSGLISLTTPTGEFVSDEEFVVGEAETALGFEPLTGPVGTEVTLSGMDFTGTTGVRLGDMDITDFTVSDDASNILFTIPEGALSGLISVTTDAGEFFSTEEFVVEEDATAFDFNPIQGPIGSEVTLTGMDFTGTTGVRLGEVDATDFTVADDGSNILFTVPEGSITGFITITTPEGEFVSAEEFMIGETVTSVDFQPVSGPVGTEVTLTGADFTGATYVTIRDVEVPVFNVAADGSSLILVIPEGALTGIITVTTPTGNMVSDGEFIVGEEVSIFDDELNEGWVLGQDWDVAESDLANTEQVFSGTQSLKIAFADAWGGFRFEPTSPMALTGNESIVLSVFGAPGGGDVKLFVMSEGQALETRLEETLDVVEGEWTTFTIPMSEFENPENITELGIRNMDQVAENTVFVDDIRIIQ